MTEPAPPHLLRSCRAVVTTAGQVASVIATDPAVILARLSAVDPRLGTALGDMTDAVMTLDHHTDYLTGLPTMGPGGFRRAL